MADAAVKAGAKELGAWVEQLSASVGGLESEGEISVAIDEAVEQINPEAFAAIVEENIVRAAMLGAIDSMLEREQDEDEPLPVLASWRAGQVILQKVGAAATITGMPFEQAVRLFEERKIIPKAHFDQLRDAAKKKAFTVAGLAQEELLQEAHGELARQIRDSKAKTFYDEATGKWVYKGPNLREFDKFAKARLETAGWTPKSASHVETIFRTATMSAYGSGRIIETTQPAVVAARPYWEIRGVNDSRQRPTHAKAQGTILSVDNPFWRRAYPPFGYNCRCRVISRSKVWVDKHGGPTRVPDGLPDKGFSSGIDASLVPAPLPVPSEGKRAPVPGKAANPIDRPGMYQPPVSPPAYRAPPIQISPTPPELPKAPIAPVPIEPPATGVSAGVHAREVVVSEDVTKRQATRVLDAFNENELAWMRKTPLAKIEIQKAVEYKGKQCLGTYSFVKDQLRLVADVPADQYGQPFFLGISVTVTSTRKTAKSALASVVHHELGHRIHLQAAPHIRAEVDAAFNSGLASPVTSYAASNSQEWFAESYAMYWESQEMLLKFDPEGFRIVRKVLDHWGIQHGTPGNP